MIRPSLLALVMACGSSGGGKMPDAAKTSDAKTLDAPSSSATLTVKNYLSWCSVSVDGNAASTTAVQTEPITATRNDLTLVATAASASFKIDSMMWHHTNGDSGGGEGGTVGGGGTMSTATVTVTAGTNKCVWVCCPFTNGTGCPTTDQCP
jgi:hypothetical protein